MAAELADGACAVEIRPEDFHDERQGIRREGDHPADLDAVVIVAILVAAGTQALATSPAEVRRDLYFAFPRLSAIRPDEPARIDGGLPLAPVVLVATGARMREGVIGGKAVQNVLRKAETGGKIKWGQKFEISLQWSFLSLHAKREEQGSSWMWQWRFDICFRRIRDKLWSGRPFLQARHWSSLLRTKRGEPIALICMQRFDVCIGGMGTKIGRGVPSSNVIAA